MISESQMASLRLPDMSPLEKKLFDFFCETSPQSMYSMGVEELGDKFMILSKENIDYALKRIRELKSECGAKDLVLKKFLESIETQYEWEEPSSDVGTVTEVLSTHLIKEGFNIPRLKALVDLLDDSVRTSLKKFKGRNYPTAIMILAQYQVLGALEILNLIDRETSDPELKTKISKLIKSVNEFGNRFKVEGFTDGDFKQVVEILRRDLPDLRRKKFYPKALRYGFDYRETPAELERKALRWIEEDLPKFKLATRRLSKILGCEPNPEAVNAKLRLRPGVKSEEALQATLKIRPIIQKIVAESVVEMNPRYDATVIETPPYLTAIIPTGAASGFDSLTYKPIQRFYITTDPKRAPPGGFADLVNLLVHEEYGHCLHFSNTSTNFAAKASLPELLSSLHSGTTSEGLAFQRELEFLDCLYRLEEKKKANQLAETEKAYVKLTEEYGGFEQTLLELEFITYKQRIIRFLRVVGDSRINSGKQDLLKFLEWAERKTQLAQRTIFYQIYPAHEGIFPGYATCYAVVGQDIRKAQTTFRNDVDKLVKFNAYACSMGYPARSIYMERLKALSKKLVGKQSSKKKSLHKPASRNRKRK